MQPWRRFCAATWSAIRERFRSSAAEFTGQCTSYTSITVFRRRWRDEGFSERSEGAVGAGASRTRKGREHVLFDSASDEVPVLESGQREHDGDPHAPTLRPQ